MTTPGSTPDSIHATAIASPEQPPRAVLLLGPPGSGKSDLALRMLARGWSLITDDRTRPGLDAAGRLTASAPPVIAGLLEVRGVGLTAHPHLPGPVPVALALNLATPPERLPDPSSFHVPGLEAAPVPCLAFNPFTPSAPLRLEEALRRHGLRVETAAMPARPVIAVSGLSGAGRSTALKALEDHGYEVVDNLPLALLESLLGPHLGSAPEPRPLAFGIDTRTRGFDADALVARLSALRAAGTPVQLLFLDCADDALVRRFSETRRRHPLALDRPAIDGIAPERALTARLRHAADLIIDTTELSVTELRRRIALHLGRDEAAGLTITIQSFGFSGGLPRHADLVFDMRFLINPHWDAELRPLTGLDPAVAAHVAADPLYESTLARITDLLDTLLPGYAREGKAYLTIAIGCTGGRHRSVAVAADLHTRLQARAHSTRLEHRDLPPKAAA